MENSTISIIIAFGLGVISSLVAAFIYDMRKVQRNTPWSRWKKRKFKPGLQGAKDLVLVRKFLGEIHTWLGTNNTQLIEDCQDTLWKVMDRIKVIESSYFATYSDSPDERIWHLRQLTQIQDDKAKEAIRAIRDNPHTQDGEKALAQQLLDELDHGSPNIQNP